MSRPLKSIFNKTLSNVYRAKKVSSFIILIIIILISTALLSYKLVGESYNYKLHDIATQNIKSPMDIVYEKKKETELEIKRAEENIPLVFDMERYILNEKLGNINFLFNHIDNIHKTEGEVANINDKLLALRNRLPNYLTFNDRILTALIDFEEPENLRKTISTILSDIYSNGILAAPYNNPLNIPNKDAVFRVQLDVNNNFQEQRKELKNIYTIDELNKILNSICAAYTKSFPSDQRWTVYVIVRSMIKPNLVFNPEETKFRINESSKTVKPIRGQLKKDHVIVRKGDPISTIDMLEQINYLNEYKKGIKINYVIGILIFQIVLFGIVVFFTSDIFNYLIPDTNTPVITGFLLIIYLLFTYFVYKSFNTDETKLIFALGLPIPFVLITLTILYEKPIAILASLFILFFTSTITDGDYNSLVISLSTIFISIFGTRSLEKRTDFLKLGFLIGFINSLLILSLGFISEFPNSDILKNIQLSFVNGFANTIAVMGFFPIIEFIFGLTTKFKLLELTDLSAPIFKEMLINAPGTYSHSIMVANMAESASKEINANALLTRVGGYYHDIGKLENSGIYIENKRQDNINFSATEYSKKIIQHVTTGINIAKKIKLPQSVVDFIEQHHGDSTMTFFYHQALEEAHNKKSKDKINHEDFRYPGPKPQSKETAILMLADNIEAASRSIQDPTYVNLEQMVKKVINNKINNGELDYSDLTLKELNKIQSAFLKFLTGVFHTRIEYPDDKEIKDLEQKVNENGNGQQS